MKCQVLVDWLTFSVKEQDPAKVIREYLGLEPELFQDAGYGLLGYNRVLRFSDICVCYEPRENDFFRDMGVCISMSGNGCRAFETMSKLTQAGQGSVFPTLFQILAAPWLCCFWWQCAICPFSCAPFYALSIPMCLTSISASPAPAKLPSPLI